MIKIYRNVCRTLANSLVQCYHLSSYKGKQQSMKINASKMQHPKHQGEHHSLKQTSASQSVKEWKSKPAANYPKQMEQLLKKKELSCMDLVFLYTIIQANNINLADKQVVQLKQQLKQIKEVEFSAMASLVQFSEKLSKVPNSPSYPNNLKNIFVSYFDTHSFTPKHLSNLSLSFLKSTGFSLFTHIFAKNHQQTAEVLKTFGSLLSVQEIKKVDSLCCNSIRGMDINNIVRFLNIFRQMKVKGNFVYQACQIIVEKQKTIAPKFLLMATISLLQLGNKEAVERLEPSIIENMHVKKGFDNMQLAAIIQVFHKFKTGSAILWSSFLKMREKQSNLSSFQHSFAFLSGLTRNYQPNTDLLKQIISLQPSLKYVNELTEKQFIQYFLVVYFHFIHLNPTISAQYQPIILAAIKEKQLKSVYKQIQNFFLFLFESDSQKQQYLKQSYPSDLQLALLAMAFPLREAVDVEQQRQYESDILSRYEQSVWRGNKKIIVVEQFIRHKLISAKREEFQQHLI